MLITLLLVCALLPTAALAAGQETIQVPFGILYIDDSYAIGYTYSNLTTKSLTCQYTTNHSSSSSHCVAYNDIRAVRDEYASSVQDGYQIVGWASTSTPSATVQINSGYWYGSGVGQSAFWMNGYTIYLVAKRDPATLKYTVTYTDGVADEEVFADDVHADLTNGSATPPFTGGTPTRSGFTFTGWQPAVSATVTADTTYTAQWEAAPPSAP